MAAELRPIRAHLVDTTLFYTPTSGGVRRYLLTKHDWLSRQRGLRHTLVVPGPADRGDAGALVEFASPPLAAGYRWPVRLRALRARLAALGPDLIEAGDPYVVGWQAARVAAARGIPAVAFCHSDLLSLVGGRLGGFAAAAVGAYLRTLYGRFDEVLAPSEIVANHLADAGIHHVRLQPLGVDTECFTPDRRDPRLRERLGLAPDVTLLVFAGRFAPEKNLGDLYAMMPLLGPRYHLLLVGGERRARIGAQVSVMPYEGSVAGMAGILGGCDLFVHAGRQETFGLVALEAMACGLPVVAYRAGALAELIDARVGRLAPATGPRALAGAVEDLVAAGLPAIGRAARERALARHSWNAAFTMLLRGHARLLGLPSPAADAPALLAR